MSAKGGSTARGKIATMSSGELAKAYEQAAEGYGQTIATDPDKANRFADVLARIYGEMRRRGVQGQSALLTLLHDRRPHVRYWAAVHALEFAPALGEPVLVELEKEGGVAGFNARYMLSEWRDGKLKLPE